MKQSMELANIGLIQKISIEVAWRYRVIPITWTNVEAHFQIDETRATQSVTQELAVILGRQIFLEPCPSGEITQRLHKFYRPSATVNVLGANKDEIVELIVKDAESLRSSDIHIERYENVCRVRFRIDGQLVQRYEISTEEFPSLINKIKIRANLDISEKRLPQDGRINFSAANKKYDIRVSSLPTLFGEKIVLRILGTDTGHLALQDLGFSDLDLERFLHCTSRTHGIILISGPTGSGKTTTLYATLKMLNSEAKNVLTIEDPIEYTLAGINQVQLKESIGLGFGTALRTFLRQDPDIIMVGEIRDPDTASMAIRASLTGHLVLSTIHTNSAWGTISRLIDMGIPSYLISSTLLLSVAQRLVRKLCEACKRLAPLDPEMLPGRFRAAANQTHCLAVGCEKCFYTGYKGRVAIYEVLPVDSDVSERIKNNAHDIQDILIAKRVMLLADQAFNLFASGITSLEEIHPFVLAV